MSTEKEPIRQFLSKIFLGELSKIAIGAIFGFVGLPVLLALGLGKLQVSLQELFHKPIIQWQWHTWVLLASLVLLYSLVVFFSAIYIHKRRTRNRTFYIFPHKGYNWKMWLLPKREIRSRLPLCPKHGVELKVFVESNKSHKCPFCDTSISLKDSENSSLVEEAFMVGEAMFDDHYKPPKEKK